MTWRERYARVPRRLRALPFAVLVIPVPFLSRDWGEAYLIGLLAVAIAMLAIHGSRVGSS